MYPLIDLHCDTIYSLNGRRDGQTILANDGHTDLRWMQQYGSVTTCFALFTQLQTRKSPWVDVLSLYERFKTEVQSTEGRLQHVTKPSRAGQSAILSIEECQILEGNLGRIETLAQWNVRLATLTWNYENDLGYPHHRRGGLKRFGFEAVEAMESHAILVDVSHLNDEGVFDVLSIAKRPVIASHSNCRHITNCSRNLSDELIRAIADSGGVVGLNFCPSFLSTDWMHSRVDDMVKHVSHLCKIGGRDVLAIGTDYDGIGGSLELDHYPRLSLLWDALISAGMTTSQLEHMWYENANRVLSAEL